MKKYKILICALMTLSLFGCNSYSFDMSTLATNEEVKKFLKDKDLDDERYSSMNFTIKIESETQNSGGKSSSNIKIKGRIRADIDENSVNMYYKAESTSKNTTYSADGKDTQKLKIKEEFTCVYVNNKYNYYINIDEKYSSDDYSYKHHEKLKSKDSSSSEFGEYIDDILSSDFGSNDIIDDIQTKYYIDGDDMAQVISTDQVHMVTIYRGNENELLSIESYIETYDSKIEMEMNFKDVERISIPKDALDYENIS